MSKQLSKEKIRKRYNREPDPDLVFFEPDPKYAVTNWEERKLRVAAYCRVSTDDEAQTSSYELQMKYYREFIAAHENWIFADIYADEGLSATSYTKRDDFKRMLRDCELGKIDLIVTKNVARFSRNVVDCLSVARDLLRAKHRVGIYFQEQNLNTLVIGTEMILTILSSLAQAESEAKRAAVLWAIDKRFKRGQFLTPTNNLLGYTTNDEGDMVVDPESAKTVRAIFTLFLQGYTTTQIAFIMTRLGRPTAKGNMYWSSGSVRGILINERHCGDVVAQKTYTIDVISHKAVKNTGQMLAIYKRDHHEGIVSRKEYIQCLLMMKSRRSSIYFNPVYTLRVIKDGLFAGFIPVNPAFGGYAPSHYVGVLENAEVELPDIEVETLRIENAEVVRISEFSHSKVAAVTLSESHLRFNKECVDFFGSDTGFVELLFHPTERILAARPTTGDNKNAIVWNTSPIGADKLNATVFTLAELDKSKRYRVMADCFTRKGERVTMFDLSNYEYVVSVEREFTKQEGGEVVITTRKAAMILQPERYRHSFGHDHMSHAAACRGWLALTLDDWKTDAPAQYVEGFDGYAPPEREERIRMEDVAEVFDFRDTRDEQGYDDDNQKEADLNERNE